MSLRSQLGFIYRGLIGIKDTIFDRPVIGKDITGFSVGKTKGGEDIICYKFGSGTKKILYFGGIHGNEVGTVKVMNRWVNYVSENTSTDATVYIIPCLNLDGYNKSVKNPDFFNGGIIGKTNGNDVDLNRNFPASNWSEKSKLFAAGKYYDISGGTSAGSESEVKALLNLIKNEKISSTYTFHNCWGTVMGTFTKTCEEKVKRYSKLSGYKIYTQSDWESLKSEQRTGHSMQWGAENNIDIIEVELKTRWGSEWKRNKKALIQSLNK